MRLFRPVKESLFATSKEKRISWVEAIPYVELGLRVAVNSTLGLSPSKISFWINMLAAKTGIQANTLKKSE